MVAAVPARFAVRAAVEQFVALGGYAVRGPGGGVAVGRQGGGYAVRGPTTVYGGAYGDRAPVAAGVVAGAAVVGAAAIMRSHIIPPVRATLYAVLSLTLRDPQW